MAGNRRKSIQAETAAIVGVAVFLLAWGVIERITERVAGQIASMASAESAQEA